MSIIQLTKVKSRGLAACLLLGSMSCGSGYSAPAGGEGAPALEASSATSESLTIGLGAALLNAPNSTPPGTSVSVTGSGFAANETVHLTLASEPVADAIADASGSVALALSIAAEMLPGVYELKAETSAGASGSARFAVRADFAQGGFAPNQARYNPYENVIGPDNLSQVVKLWRSANLVPLRGRIIAAATHLFTLGVSVPAPGSETRVLFSLNKQSHRKEWGAILGPTVNEVQGSDSVAAVYGNVYAGASDGVRVFAQNCRTDGGECQPLWTGLTGTHASSPTVYENTIYVNSGGTLYAFPSSCARATCAPLWTAPAGSDWSTSVAIYKRALYSVGKPAGSPSFVLTAYPTACRTDGGECAPLWQSALEGEPQATPVLSNDRVFLVFGNAMRAYRFNCGAGGATCQPLWKATGEGFYFGPTVAEGVVYANGTQPALYKKQPYGSSAWSVSCRSNGGECRSIFRFGTQFSAPYSMSYARGVLFKASGAYPVGNCSRDGSICQLQPWSAGSIPDGFGGPATVSDGVIYLPGLDRKLYAFGLPGN